MSFYSVIKFRILSPVNVMNRFTRPTRISMMSILLKKTSFGTNFIFISVGKLITTIAVFEDQKSNTGSCRSQCNIDEQLFDAGCGSKAYIIAHYNPSVRITAELLTPLMLSRFIYSAERQSSRKYFFSYFVLMTDLGYEHGFKLLSSYIIKIQFVIVL